jgi:Leucine-rich repeat (LRR) protein
MKNEIDVLPPEVGNLKKLKLLDVSHNRITELPQTMGSLTELKTLDASYCSIRTLPVSYNELPSLKELYLEENPLASPHDKIADRLYASMHFLT